MITIIFATYNGKKTIPRMLLALQEVAFPSANFEVIAVDNASTDGSAEIINGFREKLPLVTLYQPIRGKNRALNSALPRIQGDLVVFTDDDVLPDPNWLNEFQRCSDIHPDCDLFGGAILPHWDKTPEPWILDSVPHGVTFALTATELKEGSIDPALIWGPNMMVRRRVFEAGHRFNEDIGPNVGQYMMGSETEFNIRIVNQGYKTWFCPTSQVQHIIRDFQMTESWIIRRAYRFGRNKCYQDFMARGWRNSESSFWGLLNYPKWMIRQALQATFLGYLAKFQKNQCKAIEKLWDAAFFHGYINQSQEFKKRSLVNVNHN